ncbi:hypothetical protein ACFL52_04985, partial [Candidatus Margulisiibacteriota bacterium]
GDCGMGKTAIVSSLMKQYDERNIIYVYCFNPDNPFERLTFRQSLEKSLLSILKSQGELTEKSEREIRSNPIGFIDTYCSNLKGDILLAIEEIGSNLDDLNNEILITKLCKIPNLHLVITIIRQASIVDQLGKNRYCGFKKHVVRSLTLQETIRLIDSQVESSGISLRLVILSKSLLILYIFV